ncbi:MAG TPA: hypothetical protein DHN29_01265 [Cytophagales bacterium]|nr:hypothetical protein [Cytophagales bacterium]
MSLVTEIILQDDRDLVIQGNKEGLEFLHRVIRATISHAEEYTYWTEEDTEILKQWETGLKLKTQ